MKEPKKTKGVKTTKPESKGVKAPQEKDKINNSAVQDKVDKAIPVKEQAIVPDVKESLDKPKDVKADVQVKEVKAPKAKKYGTMEDRENTKIAESIYGKMLTTIKDIKADFDQVASQSQDNSKLNEEAYSKLVADYENAVDKTDALLKKIEDKVAAEVNKVNSEYDKELDNIDKANKAEVSDSAPRVKESKAIKENADKEALERFNSIDKEIDKLKAERLEAYNQSVAEENARRDEVDKQRAETCDNLEKDYADKMDNLKSQYDSDINSLNDKIDNMHKSYYAAQDKLKKDYEDFIQSVDNSEKKAKERTANSIAELKSKCDSEVSKYNQELSKISEGDKANIKRCRSGIKVAEKSCSYETSQLEKTLSKEIAGFNSQKAAKTSEYQAALYNLKQEFIKSIPPVEHDVRLRGYQYDVDVLKAVNGKKKQDNATKISLLKEKAENINNLSEIDRLYAVDSGDLDCKLAIAKAKLGVERQVNEYNIEVFNVEEEFKLTAIDLKRELNLKKAEVKKAKALEEQDNASRVAGINNKYALIESEIDRNYGVLTNRCNCIFKTMNAYYGVMNKRNGVGLDDLRVINNALINAVSSSLDDKQAYELYDTNLNVYSKDLELAECGVLEDKVNLIMKNQADEIALINALYDRDKQANKSQWDDMLKEQADNHSFNMDSLDKELSDYELDVATRLNSADSVKTDKLNALETLKNQYISDYNQAKATAEAALAGIISNEKSKVEDVKANLNKEYNECVKAVEINNQELANEISCKELEQSTLIVNSEKITKKATKFLLKKGEVVENTKWWIVEM